MLPSPIKPGVVVVALAILASGCAQGPADLIAEAPSGPAITEPQAPTLSIADRERLENDLDATASRQASAGRAAVDAVPTAMALSVIRQQQEEEARSLLEAATSVEPAPAAAPAAVPACDPAADPLCVPTVE
jgi:hypothetical protein